MCRVQKSSAAIAAVTAIVLTGSLYAYETGQPVPRFTATTTDGVRFTNQTLKGRVVLLQFWTTWCGVCRAAQPGLDDLDEEFADRGLVVLAVNVGESKRTVKRYLDSKPRSCKVVLTEDTNLAAIFPTRGVPMYVLIDRDGRILATQSGGGAESLRYAVNKALRTGPESLEPDTEKVIRAEAAPARSSEPDWERPRIVRKEKPAASFVGVVEPAEPRITITGMLSRFDCLGEVARIHVVAGPATHVLLLRDPLAVIIDGVDRKTRDVRCGEQKTAVPVQYVAANDDKYGTIGDVRAIDFLKAR